MRPLLLAILSSFLPAIAASSFESTVQPVLKQFCVGCHNAKQTSGGINLERYLALNENAALADRDRWELVAQKLEAGEMPPAGLPRPNSQQIKILSEWVTATYVRLDQTIPHKPGSIVAHRLNRTEYNNTIRDLLGLDLNASADFPVDPFGYGFDNIGDILSIPPMLTEKYMSAAEYVSNIAIPPPNPLKPVMSRYVAERSGQARQLHLRMTHEFPIDGEYTLRSAWFQGLRVGIKLEGRIYLDGKQISKHPLTIYTEMDRGFEQQGVPVSAGRHTIEASIHFDSALKLKDPPYLEYIQIYGPNRQASPTEGAAFRRIFVCRNPTADCARRILTPLTRRAYRRPVTSDDIAPLLALVKLAQSRGDSFESGVRLALQAILVNPNFLFRVERDPRAAPHRLTSVELASRLSYFLWSSMPDEPLLALAESGKLLNSSVLRAQLARMLADPKSSALANNFAAQWLQFRNLDVLTPDPHLFPEYDANLLRSMRTETELFFQSVVKENRSILDFIDANFTYLNERLAVHYGIQGVTGDQFRRVQLDGNPQRSGVLTHASVLTVSSYPTRTSPVIRGKWVLENLLDTPPPPPPPDVPPLEEPKPGAPTATMRQQLQKHRANPTCAGCHSRMDPIGFGLENYDAIGRWRTTEGKLPIDPSGTLPNGKSFSGAAELKAILRANPQTFSRALTVKLLTYALGRGLENYDRPAVATITRRLQQHDYRFQELVAAIVESVPFQMREPAQMRSARK